MSQGKDGHLDKEQIIRAVVDETDLPDPLRDHLASCSICRAEKERLSGALSLLGRTAKDLAPSPRKAVILPAEKASGISWLLTWHWRSLAAAGLTAALIVAIAWWNIPLSRTPENPLAMLSQEMREDDKLMTEVRWLEEHALPVMYSDISGEYSSDIQEEFVEFLIPDLQNSTLSGDGTKEVYYVA